MRPAPIMSASRRAGTQAWYRQLTRYQWMVLGTAAFGWMFEHNGSTAVQSCAPSRGRGPLGTGASGGVVFPEQAGYSTMIFMLGWALGGVVFGILGDRLGRMKTMIFTILLYSGFTGLSFFSRALWDFNVYRFLSSLGVGGRFAVGVALVAEVMPGADCKGACSRHCPSVVDGG